MKLYHTPEAAEIAGITERQIAHWIKIGVAHPTRSASGSGSRIDVLQSAKSIRPND